MIMILKKTYLKFSAEDNKPLYVISMLYFMHVTLLYVNNYFYNRIVTDSSLAILFVPEIYGARSSVPLHV